MMYPELRREVCAMNKELPRQGLVVWTGGNVSAIVREAGHVIIKPSGVRFPDLTPENMVVVDLEGEVVEGPLKPSVDVGIHNYVYRRRLDIGGITHTHSPYSSAFALLGKPIPAALTPFSHIVGRAIPCTEYVKPAHDETGEAIVRVAGDGLAVLVNRHGPFTFGASAEDSVKVATYMEEAARTIYYALAMGGQVTELPQEELDRSFGWYHANYGQQPH
jgi:L-ribulose-5-phosphate 4-epimerase